MLPHWLTLQSHSCSSTRVWPRKLSICSFRAPVIPSIVNFVFIFLVTGTVSGGEKVGLPSVAYTVDSANRVSCAHGSMGGPPWSIGCRPVCFQPLVELVLTEGHDVNPPKVAVGFSGSFAMFVI